MNVIYLALGFLMLFSFSTTLAEEGFHEDFQKLPAPVRAWEKRLFMPFSDDKQSPKGTAFLVYNDGIKAVFVTAAHVIQDPSNFIKTYSLRQGLDWTPLSDIPFETPFNLKPIEAGILNRKHPDLRRDVTARDVGYIVTTSDSRLPTMALEDRNNDIGFSLGNSLIKGKQHFVLGYPSLASRDPKLSARNTIIKPRWSMGMLIRKIEMDSAFHLETDADSIPGNSGGPIVDSEGRLIGIVAGGPVSAQYLPYPHYYTYAAPLDSVMKILKSRNNSSLGLVQKSCASLLQQ